MQRTPPPPAETPLAALPRDEEGLGRGPLGRAAVLLDRAIGLTEQAQRQGAAVDPGLLAHLRMTRQARDLIATGDTERAADLLERAIAIDDGAGFGYLYLGYVHLTAGRHDQADVFLDRAAALLPPDPALRVEIEQLRTKADALSSNPGRGVWARAP
jgi:tetratricopeptide (TPR) repeat protein